MAFKRLITFLELMKEHETINLLLSHDARSSEELAGLKQIIWQYHGGLVDGCMCSICIEVERSRTELQGSSIPTLGSPPDGRTRETPNL